MTVEVPDAANWSPLLVRLAPGQCRGFMYMGRVGTVHLYKHIITRRYLNLCSPNRAWRLTGRSGL
jgi:hypothetical protein